MRLLFYAVFGAIYCPIIFRIEDNRRPWRQLIKTFPKIEVRIYQAPLQIDFMYLTAAELWRPENSMDGMKSDVQISSCNFNLLDPMEKFIFSLMIRILGFRYCDFTQSRNAWR